MSPEAAAGPGVPLATGPRRLRGGLLSPTAVVTVGLYGASVAAALAVTAILVLGLGHFPWTVVTAMVRGSVGSAGALGRTLDDAGPVLLVAVGTLVAVRAGMFNLGQVGQLVMGATAAAFVALKLHGPGPLVLVLSLVCGAAGGALWAGLAAALYAWRRVTVVVTTLLLTYVATQVLSYVVSNQGLLKEPTRNGLPQSVPVPANVRLPHPGVYPAFGVGVGLLITVVVLVVAWVALARTPWGLRLRAVGGNPTAARRFGVRVAAVAVVAVVISGALAGLAGSVMLTGQSYRLQANFAGTFAYDGLLAALVCRDRPGWLLPISVVFGIIQTGSGFLLSTGVPHYLGGVLRALLVLAAVFPPVFLDRRHWADRLRSVVARPV